MKVLALTHRYPPGTLVGSWIATHRFLRHLAQLGHEVTVFAHRERRPSYELDGITVETGIRGRSHAFHLADDADILVSHCGDEGLPVETKNRTGLPHIRLAHGADGVDTDSADLLVFNSEAMRSAVDHDTPSIVCHPPVVADEHRTTTGDQVTIVNCSKAKGITTAWRLADQHPDRAFLGVRGGYGEQITPRATNFELIGPQRDMRTVWARTRVLLVPSIVEAYGMVGVEAMCSGIPVIAHPTPGLRESLGDAGIFCHRDDIPAWTAELERLDDPAEYATAWAAARARADELDPTDTLDRFADAVEQVAAAVTGPPPSPQVSTSVDTSPPPVADADPPPVEDRPPRYAVIGTGRSGTGYMAALLGCGHEDWWNPHGRRTPGLDGDSSWLALPSIEAGEHHGPVLHVVRHPVAVVRSLVGIGFFAGPDTRDPHGLFRRFAIDHQPEVGDDDPVVAAVEWWARWNERCAAVADATVRIEDLHESRRRVALPTVAEVLEVPLPDPTVVSDDTNHRGRSRTTAARIWRLLGGRADRFGYHEDDG